jgi:hypothetical protein
MSRSGKRAARRLRPLAARIALSPLQLGYRSEAVGIGNEDLENRDLEIHGRRGVA